MKTYVSLFLSTMLAGSAVGQCFAVTAITSGGSGQKGTMFNVVNTAAGSVTIGSFDQCFNGAGTSDVEIYTIAGTWQGNEANAGAWTLVGSTTGLVHGTVPQLDAIPIPVNVVIAPGATQGFYITATNATASNVSYTVGVNQVGAVIGSDTDISVTGGVGKVYPFGTTFGLPTAGRLWNGRVHYCPTGPGTVLATNTSIGQGCLAQFVSFYENFALPSDFDLAGSGIVMVPTGGGGYVVTTGGTFMPVGSVQAVPTALALLDDAEVTVPFTVGSFQGPNGPWTSLSIISNGKVSEAAGNSTLAAPSPAVMLAEPQTAFYTQGDWDPSAGGTVWFEESANLTTVTWDNVPSWNNVGSSNNFQMQFESSGTVTLVWTSMAAVGSNGGILVGYSPGGANSDPGNRDLSALGAGSFMTGLPEVLPLALAATSRPITGTNWGLNLTNIPATGVLGVDIFGLTDPGIDDLFFIGMPGCGLRASLDVIDAWLVAGASHAYSLAIPISPAVLNLNVYTTAAVFQVPAVNAFGAISANGVAGSIGNY